MDELKTKNFIVRWKEIISSRLDSKALKAALPDVYGQFCVSVNLSDVLQSPELR